MEDEHKELATKIVTFLNECMELDPDWVRGLVEHRVPCNDKIQNHPTLTVRLNDTAGLIGFLNGLVGRQEGRDRGYIAAVVETLETPIGEPQRTGPIQRFTVLD